MLPLHNSSTHEASGPTRRQWLQVGGLGAMGLSLADLLKSQATAATREPTFGRAKACILCFMWGGQPHQDLFDLKPQASAEVRGEFNPIPSSVPGTQLGELIPRIASQAHRFALIRSVTHPDSTHTIAMHTMMTGYRHRRPNTNPRNAADDFPCFGAVMQKLQPGKGALPSGVSVNAPGVEVPSGHIFPGFFGGFLGGSYDPMFITEDPAAPDFQPIRANPDIAPGRVAQRGRLLDQLDDFRRRYDFVEAVHSSSLFHQKALSLIDSPQTAAALDLGKEPHTLRDRYGWSSFGQGCLLARRLVEAGVRLVTVNWNRTYQPKVADLWDTHADQFNQLRTKLCPAFDAGYSALLEDLHDRGLLDDTLVVVMGEFGRTPKINKNAGRDHWPGCNSVLLAGAGIRGGAVHGASDSMAAYPIRDAVGPEDLATTIYHALGFSPRTELVDHSGRPLPLYTGQPLTQLFG